MCGTPSDAATQGSETLTRWYRSVFFQQHYTPLVAEVQRRGDTIVVRAQIEASRTTLSILEVPWEAYLQERATGTNVGDRASAARALGVVSQSSLWIILDMRASIRDACVSATQVIWVADRVTTDIHALD